ncbi:MULTISPECIES: hypothetical protein [Streptomyces]|uniref:Uncharacterized protein n=1 Tax=Streptomyces violaceoruber TaxID=1935 RepID=A0ACD4WMU8_STRVN|nr:MULTISPECIES: hypothetical protein [unclassified Streptomyces]MDX3348956.1 hypothetical protein [Streptomyces sp. ME02-6979A]MDX3407131.1 hypothetical protein [Streptomyces sp. ME02-6977A]WOY98852.1 hypothetical protein R2E43_15840 [Streptomyces violaceoruber]BDD74031.1 hypothetical protein JCM4020_46510 [Streptomyces coelicolor]
MKGVARTALGAGTAALILAFGTVVLGAPVHAAEPTANDQGAGTKEEGGRKDSGIYAAVRIQYSGSVAPNGGKGNVTSADVDWTPPPCWYAPYLGAKDFKKTMSAEIEEAASAPGMTGTPAAAIGQTKAHYEDEYGWTDTPGYKDYNVAKDGEGMFWAGVENPNEPDFLKRNSCTDLPFWVDNGEAPPPQYEEAITPEILAALAYQHMELPGTEVTLAPAQTTKVNLPTWAWLDKADFHEVQATAAIAAPGFALTATTTAKPVSLKLEPGTPDAVTYPASGECTINDDGSIGEPYARGNADRTPPCGVKYLRSSGDGTFDLQATITWEIAWTGTGGAGGDLPDGTFENGQAVTVQEIQSINR